MGLSVAAKILKQHLASGEMEAGKEIAIRIDQTLTQDATGTMAYLQFEAMGIPRVRTKLSVSYVDHNTLQTGHENADDHLFLQTAAAKFGVHFSQPGNGICHQVHLERFAVPGETVLGSDSHTPTAGGIGMLAIGAGGLDVAVAMAGSPFHLTMPGITNVRLKGRLRPWVSAKDLILELLRRLTVEGGVGRIIEFSGEGVASLTVPERATITNMGAELGATASIFPSDEVTRAFLRAQGREDDWTPLTADPDAAYDRVIEMDLAGIEPMIAKPHSPDNVVRVRDVAGLPVDQVAIGSCTNSSYLDLMRVAAMLRGRTVDPRVSLVIAPGSRQVLSMIARNGRLADLIAAGARILEAVCGPCIGMGQAPRSGGVSVRTFNRNFEGRSGTADARVFLASPETAVACAVKGEITDPRELGDYPEVAPPEDYELDDRGITPPPPDPESVEIVRGPNIRPLPVRGALADRLEGPVLIRLGDNVTTDHIMPAGAKILPLRSNIPAISEYVFSGVDPGFPQRAREAGGGFIAGGHNYGQGSSREHAALAPMYLGVKAVIARSFARIHRANLINFGILPLWFVNCDDYESVRPGDTLVIEDVRRALTEGNQLEVQNATRGLSFPVRHDLSERQVRIMLAGGLLNHVRNTQAQVQAQETESGVAIAHRGLSQPR